MTIVALQSPWPMAVPRSERPVLNGIETRAITAVMRLPGDTVQRLIPDRERVPDRAKEKAGTKPGITRSAEAGISHAPEPFPAMRFPDPLPNLPELDLPAKANAYQSALGMLRRGTCT